MIYELIRAFVQRVLQDKILLGLVVLGVVAMVVSMFGWDGKEKSASKDGGDQKLAGPPPSDEHPTDNAQNAVDPKTAKDFIVFWLSKSMDYDAKTAQKSHLEAAHWMTPDAIHEFEQSIWRPEPAQGVMSGKGVAG